MTSRPTHCLVLACGNTLRGDDGVGPWLADWAEEYFRADSHVRVISRQQWTPELAAEIAGAEAVLFIDCSIDSTPGAVILRPVESTGGGSALGTHHIGAQEILALARELNGLTPRAAMLLTIGGACFNLGEAFSAVVKAALPEACSLIERAVAQLLS